MKISLFCIFLSTDKKTKNIYILKKRTKTKDGSRKASQCGGIKIDKRGDSNYHVWKEKIYLILTYREIDETIAQENPSEKGTIDHKAGVQGDKTSPCNIRPFTV